MNDSLLHKQLLDQNWVRGNNDLAGELIHRVETEKYASEGVLYKEDDDDDTDYYLWMVLKGEGVVLSRSGHTLRHLGPGECFGEFPLLDPGLRLTVTATVKPGTVIGRLSQSAFHELADVTPAIGLNLARMLVARLMNNNAIFQALNPVPKVFLGSSVEGLKLVRMLEDELQHDKFDLQSWARNGFEAGVLTMEALVAAAQGADFAVFIATPDDIAEKRGVMGPVARDNVLFEFGLFLGTLGRSRTILVQPNDPKLVMPTDLASLTTATYQTDHDGSPRVGPIANALRAKVQKYGARARILEEPSA
jgi:CRP/FNR family transcriptional regulator, cyclic AMP receptor protein